MNRLARLNQLLESDDSPIDVNALVEGFEELFGNGEFVYCHCRYGTPRAKPEDASAPSEVSLTQAVTLNIHPELPLTRQLAIVEQIERARSQWVRREQADTQRSQLLKVRGCRSFYTPSMLRRFLGWEGENCAFPLCDEPQMFDADTTRTHWHLCITHRSRLLSVLTNNRKRRRQNHGATARKDTDA
jgi:hypothetical protein